MPGTARRRGGPLGPWTAVLAFALFAKPTAAGDCVDMNYCNGHGTCVPASDSCDCYEGWGAKMDVAESLTRRRNLAAAASFSRPRTLLQRERSASSSPRRRRVVVAATRRSRGASAEAGPRFPSIAIGPRTIRVAATASPRPVQGRSTPRRRRDPARPRQLGPTSAGDRRRSVQRRRSEPGRAQVPAPRLFRTDVPRRARVGRRRAIDDRGARAHGVLGERQLRPRDGHLQVRLRVYGRRVPALRLHQRLLGPRPVRFDEKDGHDGRRAAPLGSDDVPAAASQSFCLGNVPFRPSPPPRNIRVVAAASPRPASME